MTAHGGRAGGWSDDRPDGHRRGRPGAQHRDRGPERERAHHGGHRAQGDGRDRRVPLRHGDRRRADGAGTHGADGRDGGRRDRRSSCRRDRRRGGSRDPRVDDARLISLQALTKVREDDAYANLVLPGLLEGAGLGRRDAGFATALTYGALRLQGRYDAVIARCSDRPLSRMDAVVLDVLRLGAHQLLGMRVPSHAAVSTTVDLAAYAAGRSAATFVNAVLRRVSERDLDAWLAVLRAEAPDRAAALAAVESHPVWVVRAMRQALLANGRSEDELEALLRAAARRRPGAVVADLRIARGLDYYTGTVYESFMAGHEDLGSVCSGGRYDSLASNGRRTFPGVGISIGLSRLLSRVMGAGLIEVTRAVPTAVLVAVTDEEHRPASDAVADTLRGRGIAADVAPTAAKFGRQIRFADKRGIPFVWFTGADGASDSVKDIRSGEQVDADAATWTPADRADLVPRLLVPSGGPSGA